MRATFWPFLYFSVVCIFPCFLQRNNQMNLPISTIDNGY
ncbi:hypothetical protein S7335_5552 [Synechococcus sp. PCC 7335]|nr:hypothetical protein S7335_5552 [Synechococcus sp. PCC 7335]